MSKSPRPLLMMKPSGQWVVQTAKKWPPREAQTRDRDASRWFNSRFTTSSSLFNALAFFLSTGWPTESLDDFLDSIVPKAGWADHSSGTGNIRLPVSGDHRRERNTYGADFSALLHGYWEHKK